MPFGKSRQIYVIGLKIILRGVGANIIIAWPVNVGDFQKLWSELYSIQLLSVLRKHLVIGQFNFCSVFLCFSLVTLNRHTFYDSGILRQDCGIIRVSIGHN